MRTVRWPIVALMIAGAIFAGLVIVFARGSDDGPVSTDATTTVAEPATTATTTTTTTIAEPATTTTTSIARSAADDLAAFFSRAAESDRALKAAAASVNASITENEMVVDQTTVDLVEATRSGIQAVKAAVPAGLEPDLLRATLPVFSDLVSRSYAMSASVGRDLPYALQCLEIGSGPAAARYPADLAALQALARSSPPVEMVAPDSRAAEYVALHLAMIEHYNGCCEGCGGSIVTELAEITFVDNPPVDPETGRRADGYIYDEFPFQADYDAGTGWSFRLGLPG